MNQPLPSSWCERLYEAKASVLILYGRALGLSHGEAEDVLQETFLSLLKVSEPENPECYCIRSFRNRALNYRRTLWRRLTRELESQHWFEKSPEELSLEKEVRESLALLPVEQREVIVLKIWHQLTFQQIADAMDESPHTIAGRYRYGLNKLKSHFQRINYERRNGSGVDLAFFDSAETFPQNSIPAVF
jgi:RNA polymerase sigma-70 factor, ECF subfamily